MNFEKYKGKKARVKHTGFECYIIDVRVKRDSGVMSARFVLSHPDGSEKEYYPHEVEVLTEVDS